MQEHEPSEGEKIIAYFFDDQEIKYKKEVEIHDLKGDSKAFRKADFYLPKYKVYVEFLGQWDHPDRKRDYKEKMALYENNKKPCVYIYPDNLGTLNDIFKMRLQKELEKYPELKWQLIQFKRDKLKNLTFICMALLVVGSLILIVLENILNERLVVGNFFYISVILLTLAIIALLMHAGKQIFKKNNNQP
jgi:hypothetical protein